MKATVCELPNNWSANPKYWARLRQHLASEASQLLLLPEMPFYRWLCGRRQVDADQWRAAAAAHEHWLGALKQLPVKMVIGTRPTLSGTERFNEGFIWHRPSGYHAAHTKYYLPNEPGFYEAEWYQRGSGRFDVVEVSGIKIGFLICTELWFNVHARKYGQQDVQLLVCPRATPMASIDTWLNGGRTAAMVAGAYCLSSNLSGDNVKGIDFGGTGWIIEPEAGRVLATTSPAAPFVTLEIDLAEADRAKQTYPRYVAD